MFVRLYKYCIAGIGMPGYKVVSDTQIDIRENYIKKMYVLYCLISSKMNFLLIIIIVIYIVLKEEERGCFH